MSASDTHILDGYCTVKPSFHDVSVYTGILDCLYSFDKDSLH